MLINFSDYQLMANFITSVTSTHFLFSNFYHLILLSYYFTPKYFNMNVKNTNQNQQRNKVKKEAWCKFSSLKVTRDIVNSPSKEVWQHLWNVVYRWHSQPRVVIWHWSHSHIPNSALSEVKQVNTVNHTPHCLYKPCRCKEPYLSVREQWDNSWNPSPQTPV